MLNRAICVITMGDPVPGMLARRGPFSSMIQAAAADVLRSPVETVDVRTHGPPAIDSASAFILTGSSSNVPTREPWMLRTEAWLREVVGVGIPTLGICFGHQILAQALGGNVERNPRGREIGTIRVERLAEDPIFKGIPMVFEANATHIDTVATLPQGATVLARSSLDDRQVLRFTRACYGVQFHPEMDSEIIRGYLEARRDVLREEGRDADEIASRVTDATFSCEILRNFLRYVVPSASAG